MDKVHVRFFKRLGIRLLRFFGVACAFVGYVIVVLSLVFGFVQLSSTGLGLGFIGLGVPHILAANRLQKIAAYTDPVLARSMEPRPTWLLLTSLILPGSIGIWLFTWESGEEAHRFYIGISAVYLFGVLIVFLRRASEWSHSHDLRPWDRTYIRWGWLVFLVAGYTLAALIFR